MKSWPARGKAVIGMLFAAPMALAALAALTTPAILAHTARASAAVQAGNSPTTTAASATRPVVVIGISGLRWTDVSPVATPALWRLAEDGSVGSLVVSAVRTFTCPADAWLTLNAGARATATAQAGPCRMPDVIQNTGAAAAGAWVPALDDIRPGSIENLNKPDSYAPCWGLLAGASFGGTGCPPAAPVPNAGCATAIGPGAALALASPAGVVQNYAAEPGATPRSLLRKCPLTVVDLGTLPGGGTTGSAAAREAAVRAADRAARQLIAAAPAGAIIVAAGIGDDAAPHVHAIIVTGPGFGPGLLTATSTRQPGMVAGTDLTPSILAWLGRSHATLVGAVVASSGRGPLASAVRMLIAQDTAAQVYRSTMAWFFVTIGLGEILLFAGLALALRGSDPARTWRRLAAYQVAGITAAAIPAGTFLASVVPWAELSHPALLLYGLGLAWAAVIAVLALTGPWRHDPLGPAGFVGAVTAAVIAGDVMTGSHLQLSTPFGLPVLVAGRWYGIGNNALGGYATGGIICITWAGVAALRAGSRTRALVSAGVITVGLLVACASPAFGAKAGGTIAMTPACVLLLAALAGVRVTPLRSALITASGLVLITVFAVLSYILPALGASDIGAFVGHVLDGSAGPILNRKASANLHSLTETWFTPVVPLLAAAAGLMIGWPQRFRLRVLARAVGAEPMLRPMLTALWTACVLGWLADDSGVSVAAAALPLALPLAIVVITQLAATAPTAAPTAAPPQVRADSEGAVQAPGRSG